MRINNLIAIDPGASGGFAWLQDDVVHVCRMPEGMSAQIDHLRHLAATGATTAVIEKVGFHRPGNSAVATATFARHVGHLEAAAYSLGISVHQIVPAQWMKSFGALPRDKRARKHAIREELARRFPHLSVTLSTADALAILEFARCGLHLANNTNQIGG
jgi:hypothetical protein